LIFFSSSAFSCLFFQPFSGLFAVFLRLLPGLGVALALFRILPGFSGGKGFGIRLRLL